MRSGLRSGVQLGYLAREDRVVISLPVEGGLQRFSLTRRQCIFLVERCEGQTRAAGKAQKIQKKEPDTPQPPQSENGGPVLAQLAYRRSGDDLTVIFRRPGSDALALKLAPQEQKLLAAKLRQLAERAEWNIPAAQGSQRTTATKKRLH